LFLLATQQGIDPLACKLVISGNDQHIHIAALVLFAPRKRPKNKRHHHLIRNRLQSIAQPFPQPDGADDDLLERLVDGRVRICLIEPMPVAAEDAALGKQLQFPLHRSGPAATPPHDLPQIKRLPRPQEHHRQNGLPSAAKQNVPKIDARNHIADNCTHFGCTDKQRDNP
jgi:hypothetical protein